MSGYQQKRIRSDEAIVRLLDKLVSEITVIKEQGDKTYELVKKQIPFGAIEPLPVKAATTTPQSIRFHQPYFSLNVVNDGDNDCFIIINTEKSYTTSFVLKAGSSEEIDMKTAKIEDIRFYTEAGTTTIRIRGLR